MEENRLNNYELKQVAGGNGNSEFRDAAIIVKTTDYYGDKNMEYLKGKFFVDDEVWTLSCVEGSRGTVFHVKSRTGHKEGYVPKGTVKHDPDA